MANSGDPAEAYEGERQGRERDRLAASILALLRRVPNAYQSWDYTKTHQFKRDIAAAHKAANSKKATLEQLQQQYANVSSYYRE